MHEAMVAPACCSPRTDRALEGTVGEVIVFGTPPLRVRRKPTTSFCEVTILPARVEDTREGGMPHQLPKRRGVRKSDTESRPTGVGRK